MKSCLKHSTSAPHMLHQPTPSTSPTRLAAEPDARTKDEKRKYVTFPEDDEVEVFYVEDWDRSPAAVVERLTYKDVYELKEMHMALPRIRLGSERMRPSIASANAGS